MKINQTMMMRLALFSAGGATLMLSACSPLIPLVVSEDAGNESYMRQAVPILQGRKIRGYEETKLLRDIAQITSRDIVLRSLMEQPDYRDHWAETLVDNLQIHREGARGQASCYGAPLRAGSDSDVLAEWLRTHAPTSPTAPLFNMSDVMRSSLKLEIYFRCTRRIYLL